MLVFIENTPRAYAWGSRDALPELLGVAPSGEPQAELWLGDHPGAPASLARAGTSPQTLIELIESDPDLYGVDGGHLPFLLKVLAIGAPLSLQVHPDKRQAEAGFAREEAAGVPRDARRRNYGDPNHKPELLVAVSEVTALCGFRPLAEARRELLVLAEAAGHSAGGEALRRAADLCAVEGEAAARAARTSLLEWMLGGGVEIVAAVEALAGVVRGSALARAAAPLGAAEPLSAIGPHRLRALRELAEAYPGDPGVLVSLLLHLVRLGPGQAVYLGAQQLHAYLGGIGVEVMAASDNVLRAGLTEKHIDTDELLRVVDPGTLDSPLMPARELAPGLIAWQPAVPDFSLMRASLRDPRDETAHDVTSEPWGSEETGERAESVVVDATHPLVLVVTEGRARVERVGGDLVEFANVRRGQSLYVSAGEPIELSGRSQVFLATVGESWATRR